MEKPKNLHAQPMDMNSVGDGWREGRYWQRGAKRKNWDNCNNIIKHTFKKEQDSKFLIIYKTTITKPQKPWVETFRQI